MRRNSVIVWEVDTGRPLHRFEGQWSADFADKGDVLAFRKPAFRRDREWHRHTGRTKYSSHREYGSTPELRRVPFARR